MKLKSKILIIAGSDSSGGAGIQADIKTVSSLGSYALTAITAVTAQNTKGVHSVIPVPPNDVSMKRSEVFDACASERTFRRGALLSLDCSWLRRARR